MAFDKLIDALNYFRAQYVKELTNSLTEKNLISSGNLGESLKINVQPKVKVFGQIYHMQINMADYGENVDEGRKAGKGLPVGVIEGWLKYPNTLQKVTGQDKRLDDYQLIGKFTLITHHQKIRLLLNYPGVIPLQSSTVPRHQTNLRQME